MAMALKLAEKTNEEWVEDRVAEADQSQGMVFACQEARCEPLPPHAHSARPYLAWKNPSLTARKR
jgi:hypothetical protein